MVSPSGVERSNDGDRVVASAAGGVEDLRVRLVEPLLDRGFQVAVTLTPTAAAWLQATDELSQIEKATDLPVRVQPHMPGQNSPHPTIDAYIAAPASAISTAANATVISSAQVAGLRVINMTLMQVASATPMPARTAAVPAPADPIQVIIAPVRPATRSLLERFIQPRTPPIAAAEQKTGSGDGAPEQDKQRAVDHRYGGSRAFTWGPPVQINAWEARNRPDTDSHPSVASSPMWG